MDEITYVPSRTLNWRENKIVDISIRSIRNDCHRRNKKLVVELDIGHTNGKGFQKVMNHDIEGLALEDFVYRIWFEVADKVVFSDCGRKEILKDRNMEIING